MFNGYALLLVLGVCVACALHGVYAKATGSVDGGPVDVLSRDRRFVVVNGEGVPEYPDIEDDDGGYDYDGDYYPDDDLDDDHDLDDLDDDDDYDHDHGHHYWWYHYYHHHHHDGPTLPFPLFPPFRRHHGHRRPVPGCDQWPFKCHNRLEVIQWLQCYYEFVGGPHENVYPGHGTVVHTF